jgi:predicted permease
VAPFNSREWGHHYGIVGRLRDGLTIDRARTELAAIGRAAVTQFARPPWADMSRGLAVRGLQEQLTADVRPALLSIVGAVLLLLAIACVNVTNLLLARGAQRRAEFAMRVALGASRGRLLRQLLVESVLIALVGGMLGLVVAQAGVGALVALSPPGLPRVNAIRIDTRVFAFALVVTTIVGLAIGFIPAFGAVRTGLNDSLQRTSRRTAGGRTAARRMLVVAEVALALVLLVSAGLLMRSLARLFAVDPGFRSSHLVTMQVVEPGIEFRSDTARRHFYEEALDAVRNVPGVTSAAFTSQLPFTDDLDAYGVEIESGTLKPGEDPSDALQSGLRYVVTPGYFQTMGIPLLRGRALEPNDATMSPESVVISQSLARQEFGSENPIGRRIRMGPEVVAGRPWDIVIGVVGDVKQQSLATGQTQAFYVAMGRWWWVDNVQSLVVRTATDPAALVPSLERAIWSVNANNPIQRVATMDALVTISASQRRFALLIIESFAFAALALAAIGLYGVLSGSVTERMRELGVRSALGASCEAILGLVIRQGMLLTAAGVVLGIVGAIVASRALTSLLFGISHVDPGTYIVVTLLLAAVSLLACALPAWRAARVDPVITLRAE